MDPIDHLQTDLHFPERRESALRQIAAIRQEQAEAFRSWLATVGDVFAEPMKPKQYVLRPMSEDNWFDGRGRLRREWGFVR